MSRFYKLVVEALTTLFAWSLDYLYAIKWLGLGLVISRDSSVYRRYNVTDKPTVILIPGVYESWHFMRPVARAIYSWGYDVRVIETLRYNTGSIEDLALLIDEFIKAENIGDCAIVAHSKGGLIGKYLLANYNHGVKFKKLISINSPYLGSRYACLSPLKSLQVFRPGSDTLSSLSANQAINSRIVSIYSRFDPHIPEGSFLEGAKNIEINDIGHFKILSSPKVLKYVKLSLDDNGGDSV